MEVAGRTCVIIQAECRGIKVHSAVEKLNVVQHDWNTRAFQMGMLHRCLWRPLHARLNMWNERMDHKARKSDFHRGHKGQLGGRKEFKRRKSPLGGCYNSLGKRD